MDSLDGTRQTSGLQGAGCFLLPVQLTMEASAYQGFRSPCRQPLSQERPDRCHQSRIFTAAVDRGAVLEDTHEGLQVAASARWRAG